MPVKVIKIKAEFIDNRGKITRIIDQTRLRIRSILLITSKARSIRGEHFHKKDSHYIYCLKGKFKYSERDAKNKKSSVSSVMLKPGDLVLTHPMIAHAMEFKEDSVFLALTTESRSRAKYEKDTVRVKITQK